MFMNIVTGCVLTVAALLFFAGEGVLHAQEEVVARPHRTGDEPLFDNPVDAWLIAHSGPAGEAVEGDYPADHPRERPRRYELLDTSDVRSGDFSVTFEVTDPQAQGAFGFFTGPYIDRWVLEDGFALHLQVKAEAEAEPGNWEVALYDTEGMRAASGLAGMAADGQWHRFNLELAGLERGEGFDFSSLRSVQVEAELPEGARIWLDGVYFEKGEELFGVSDKTITQYMAEAEATRQRRAEETLATPIPGQFGRQFAAFWDGTDLEEANELLDDLIEKLVNPDHPDFHHGTYTLYNPLHGHFLNDFYFALSSRGKHRPGSLDSEVERKLLDAMWMNDIRSNDVAIARQSTWWTIQSENHDVHVKMKALLSSQLFMHEPDYADRVYPNPGTKIGFHGPTQHLHWIDTTAYGDTIEGDGDYGDGRDYRPRDQYEVWVEFWKEWFAERARHGFFNEHNATGYSQATVNMLLKIYLWGEDNELRRQARMFQDLIWAQWLQDQVLLIQGGAATRGGPGWGSMQRMAQFLLGGPGKTPVGVGTSHRYALSDYKWPRVLWEMALDRRGRGEYAFVSRKPNEEQDIDPQPAGTETCMLLRPDSRIVRYSWVTPEYVMGMRMDHRNAIYTHISVSGQGMTFPTSPDSVINFNISPYYMAVQDRNVALLFPKMNWIRNNMRWFGGGVETTVASPAQVRIGNGIDRIEERQEWVFVQEGEAFVAIRFLTASPEEYTEPEEGDFPLLDPQPDSYKREGRTFTARELNTALVVEASSLRHHSTLEDFQEDILDNPLRLETIRPYTGRFSLRYRGVGDGARELYLNCAALETPKIDGEYISYESAAFDSPWLQGEFGEGVVTLTGPVSGEELVLDFNRIERRQ